MSTCGVCGATATAASDPCDKCAREIADGWAHFDQHRLGLDRLADTISQARECLDDQRGEGSATLRSILTAVIVSAEDVIEDRKSTRLNSSHT